MKLKNLVFRPGHTKEYFIEKYGDDFLNKLPMYRTASLDGERVAIMEVDVSIMEALVRPEQEGKAINCSVYDLDNFVP